MPFAACSWPCSTQAYLVRSASAMRRIAAIVARRQKRPSSVKADPKPTWRPAESGRARPGRARGTGVVNRQTLG